MLFLIIFRSIGSSSSVVSFMCSYHFEWFCDVLCCVWHNKRWCWWWW